MYLDSFSEFGQSTGLLEIEDDRYEQLQTLAVEAAPRYQAAQDTALQHLVEVVQGVDPVPLLCGMILLTRLEVWGTYYEPHSVSLSLDLELVAAIISGLPSAQRRSATAEDLRAVSDAAREVRWWARAVGLAHSHAEERSAEAFTRRDLLGRWFVWRGHAYPPHAKAVARALTRHLNNSAVRFGFAMDDLLDLANALDRQWEQRISAAMDNAWDEARQATGESPTSLGHGTDSFIQNFLTATMKLLPWALCTPLNGQNHLLDDNRHARENTILERFGLRPGGSNPVSSVLIDPPQRSSPFLLLPAPLGSQPFPDGSEVALLVNPAALSTDLHLTVESAMASQFPKWPAARARAVDEHAVELLHKALPGSRAFPNVYIDGPTGREEIDGIVIYEDIALVIEGKGAPLKLAARRGSIERLVNQLNVLVTEGYRQLQRDRAYVLAGRPARFFDGTGRCVLEIDGSTVRRCYQVMPTLDGLADFGTSLPRLVELGVLPAGATPWIIGLTNLHIVTDILNRPAELVAYLDFRTRWAVEPRLFTIDELEMLALFLYQVDLPARLAEVPSGGLLAHAPNQPMYDDWYAGLSGAGPVVAKPHIKCTKRIRHFVDELYRAKPPGWLASASAALQLPYTVAAALDELEPSLALEAQRDGGTIHSNGFATYVVIGQDEPWQESIDEIDALDLLTNTPLVCLLRQRGSRLQLKDVRLTKKYDGNINP